MNPRAALTRVVLALPDPVLIAMSGGPPVEDQGHRLDARLQFLDSAARKRRAMHTLGVRAARASIAGFWASIAPPAMTGVRARDTHVEQAGHSLNFRMYTPLERSAGPASAILYLHMGGGVIGDLNTCDAFCRMLALETGALVASLDYRLAPEHPFPAGLEDALRAYEWLMANAAALGVAPGRIAIAGDSMGGSFAAITCQEARVRGWAPPVLQVLIYPAVDLAARTQSHDAFGQLAFLSRQTMDWFMELYLPEGIDRTQPRLSPIRHADLCGLPPALIYTAHFDALRDEGRTYAEALRAAGNSVLHRDFSTLAHGFTAFTGVVPAARRACLTIAQDVAAALGR